MEEILELKEKLMNHSIQDAILLVDELETMGRQDKINTLESFLVVLLVHLIKIQIERRITNSWLNSITNSLLEIQDRNRLGKKSHYIKQGNWDEYIDNKESRAVLKAAKEIFSGINVKQLRSQIDFLSLRSQALFLLDLTYTKNAEEIDEIVQKIEPNITDDGES